MLLKPYQQTVIDDLSDFLGLLSRGMSSAKAFKEFWNSKKEGLDTLMPAYQDTLPTIPNVCVKVPTGGGKTFLAASALKPIFTSLPTRTRAIVWLVPSDSILEQTKNNLKNPTHPYRQRIDVDFSNCVEIYEKSELLSGANFSPVTVRENLSIFVLSYDSFRTSKKDGRKAYQQNSSLTTFAEYFHDQSILLADTDETALIQVIRSLNPVVIVDESHHATSNLSREMLQNFNPAFILELTATPKPTSNIISYVDATALKKANMVKLPVIVYNRKTKEEVIVQAIDTRNKLEELAKSEKEYIRPIVLFQAQPRTDDDAETFEKIRENLTKLKLIPKNQIAIKTADKNELKGVDLMSPDCPIRYIITVNALKEGWDAHLPTFWQQSPTAHRKLTWSKLSDEFCDCRILSEIAVIFLICHMCIRPQTPFKIR
jgi:type III restriction enzyme